jgi:excisionase family DNA binding protein
MVIRQATAGAEELPPSLAAQAEAQPVNVLTFEEMRGKLRISRSHAYALVASGELRSFTIGRSRRFTEAAVIEYIAQREAGG